MTELEKLKAENAALREALLKLELDYSEGLAPLFIYQRPRYIAKALSGDAGSDSFPAGDHDSGTK